jgi:hypothetical protein
MGMLLFELAVLALCLSVARSTSNRTATCLDIQLIDMYGDGWNGEKFFIETPWGEIFSDAPTCDENKISHTFCTDAAGNYPMMLIHENESFTPENYWEDLFIVSVSKSNETVATYTGGYNSTIIFNYEAQSDEWSVVYWENLWENEKSCDACGDAKACKPKSKKSKKSRKPSTSTVKPIHSSDDDDSSNSTKTGKNSSKKSRGSKPRYGPAAVNLRVAMFDDAREGWWKQDYQGASWYLADDRRTSLFQTGSLCSDESKRSKGKRVSSKRLSGYCNLCLGDGTYSMRFSGDRTSQSSSWDFCGVRGGYGQELTFHVKKGKCIADSLLGVEADCFGTVVSTVVVRGVVNLLGLTSEFVESSQYSILPGLLADSVVGWEAKNIEVQSATLTSRALVSTARSLAEFDVDVEFTASFESESDFGVEGRLFSKVQNLVASLEDSLSSRVSSESFSVGLAHSATLAGAFSLEKIQAAELVSLELESIAYEGVETMQASTLPAFDDSEYWATTVLSISSYNVESVAMFFIAISAGFVAFVGLVSRSMSGYTRLSQSGEMEHEVMPSEMDTSISNPLTVTKGSLRTEVSSSL